MTDRPTNEELREWSQVAAAGGGTEYRAKQFAAECLRLREDNAHWRRACKAAGAANAIYEKMEPELIALRKQLAAADAYIDAYRRTEEARIVVSEMNTRTTREAAWSAKRTESKTADAYYAARKAAANDSQRTESAPEVQSHPRS